MELLTPFDSDTAAAGDHFDARLTAPLRDGKRLIAPKGALIEGRVSDVEIDFRPAQVVTFGLIPESLEIGGARVLFAARLDPQPFILAKAQKRPKKLQPHLPKIRPMALPPTPYRRLCATRLPVRLGPRFQPEPVDPEREFKGEPQYLANRFVHVQPRDEQHGQSWNFSGKPLQHAGRIRSGGDRYASSCQPRRNNHGKVGHPVQSSADGEQRPAV
jgi:hypothetical protein